MPPKAYFPVPWHLGHLPLPLHSGQGLVFSFSMIAPPIIFRGHGRPRPFGPLQTGAAGRATRHYTPPPFGHRAPKGQ